MSGRVTLAAFVEDSVDKRSEGPWCGGGISDVTGLGDEGGSLGGRSEETAETASCDRGCDWVTD